MWLAGLCHTIYSIANWSISEDHILCKLSVVTSYREISFQNPYAFWVTTGCMMMLCGLLWKRLLSILFSSLTRSPPPRRLTPPTSSRSRGRWQHSTNDHQLIKTSNLYHFSNLSELFLLSIIVVQHDSPIKQLNLINHCGTPLYTYVPTRNAKLLTPSVGGQWNLGEIGIGAARKSMLLFHTPTIVKVLRIVGLSLITLMCLQEMQNCWHPQWNLVENRDRNRCSEKSMYVTIVIGFKDTPEIRTPH